MDRNDPGGDAATFRERVKTIKAATGWNRKRCEMWVKGDPLLSQREVAGFQLAEQHLKMRVPIDLIPAMVAEGAPPPVETGEQRDKRVRAGMEAAGIAAPVRVLDPTPEITARVVRIRRAFAVRFARRVITLTQHAIVRATPRAPRARAHRTTASGRASPASSEPPGEIELAGRTASGGYDPALAAARIIDEVWR